MNENDKQAEPVETAGRIYAWVYVDQYGIDSAPTAEEWCEEMIRLHGGSMFPLYTVKHCQSRLTDDEKFDLITANYFMSKHFSQASDLIDRVVNALKRKQAYPAPAVASCEHQYHYFGDQKLRRCNKCCELESPAVAVNELVRLTEDDLEKIYMRFVGYEGLSPRVFHDITGCVMTAMLEKSLTPAVAVNQRMQNALREIANTVEEPLWYQELAEKALECANHSELPLEKVPAVAVNEQMLDVLNETQRDLTILLGNIFASSKRDKNWEGMYDIVNGWITRNHKAIAAAEAAKRGVL